MKRLILTLGIAIFLTSCGNSSSGSGGSGKSPYATDPVNFTGTWKVTNVTYLVNGKSVDCKPFNLELTQETNRFVIGEISFNCISSGTAYSYTSAADEFKLNGSNVVENDQTVGELGTNYFHYRKEITFTSTGNPGYRVYTIDPAGDSFKFVSEGSFGSESSTTKITAYLSK